ncbi:pentatricopeptide repeat-containing protein At1g80270, mitochondrial-like [Rhodamnia argentea]|uniref:Pentatricopeptide repeat-containing protein At1g80270, mitochondrial-like n=1 Tax=Rhodamnia argentea TaxID=178133 RepID=A0A8B8NB63_9MYRT|nr:pentatricopeptide repeat-containing protein At1g80270, mitochondrial-like [Rhodamnia argentea]
MWGLRRASGPLKNCSFGVALARSGSLKSESHVDNVTGIIRLAMLESFYQAGDIFSRPCMAVFSFSSNARGRTCVEEDDYKAELGASISTKSISESKEDVDDELISELEASDNDDEESSGSSLEKLERETRTNKRTSSRRASLALFKDIIGTSSHSLQTVLDKWLEEGKDLGRDDISLTMSQLRSRRMYGRALQLSEWFKNHFSCSERDYASQVDLIAKVHGLEEAENYVENIPESFREEIVYRTLLANCVVANNIRKAEEIFNKMRDLEFALTSFACNQLLLLYSRHDKKKISDVLLLMEKENVKPSPFTYRLLINVKGLANDLKGMDQIVEMMKAEGMEIDLKTEASLARHYLSGGMKEKAEAIVKEMEGGDLKRHRPACKFVLPIYAGLGKADEVRRVWAICMPKPTLLESGAAMEAWGKLNDIKEAEAIFNLMMETGYRIRWNTYLVLLKMYVDNKMPNKAKDLVRRMSDSGCDIGPLIWDALVRLYVEAGEVEKADSFLQRAVTKNPQKPMYSSMMAIMEEYAKRGDVHKSEKIFHQIRQAGYTGRARLFRLLIVAYINAKAPAYGLRERMEADDIFPDKDLARQLAGVNPFKRTSGLNLLD